MMYSEDTFFHLSPYGRVGLVILSLMLSAILLGVFWKVSSKFRLLTRPIFALVFIWIFTWLSPQAYYLYYIKIIDGLPLQNVIHMPPSIMEILKTITFSGESNLSNHSKGILFWAMIIISLNKNDVQSTQTKP